MVRDQNCRLLGTYLMFSHLLLFLSFSTDKIKSIAMNLLQGKEKKRSGVAIPVGGADLGALENRRKKSEKKDMMKEWTPPHVLTQWVDQNKQKHVVVVINLPTGVAHRDTTNCDIEVGESQKELIVKIIWPTNSTDVGELLKQFSQEWMEKDENIRKKLALEDAFNQLKEKQTDFVRSKFVLSLPFAVQSKFDYEFLFDTINGFRALMVFLDEPDAKFEGGMRHKMVAL